MFLARVTGSMVATAVEISERLGKRGASIRLLSMHTVSPIDVEAIEAAARETRYLVTLEEHSIVGGLGSAVAEVVSTMEGQTKLKKIQRDELFGVLAGHGPSALPTSLKGAQ